MSVRSLKVKKESFKALDAWTSGPNVILAYRDSDGEKTTKVIKDYGYGRWYFYIAKSDLPKIKDKIDDLKNGDIDVIENDVRFEEEGDWVKVFVHNGNINERYTERTDDRVRLKTLFERSGVKVYEADLKLHKRYCIDNKVETSDDYRVLYYDIETDDRNNGIQMSRDRILTIACMDQNGTVCFFHDENEKEMLLRFYDYVKDFDIMVGYNSDNFDKPYILKRLGVHFLEKEAQYFKYRIAHIDLMQLFIKRFAGDSDITSWSLDFISKYFLGHGKVEGVKFGNGVGYKLYRENFEKFMEYNIGDARNLYELNQALSIVDQVILECQICGAFPSKFSISEILDSYILKSVQGKGVHFASINYTQHQIRCPQCNHTNDSEVPLDEIVGEFVCSRCSHKFDVNDTEEITGAHVFEPVAGLHDNVFVLDYKCWLPGTQIYTESGYKNIEDVQVGTRVQVMGGVFDSVCQVHNHIHSGDIVKIKLDTGNILQVTPDHRFPIFNKNGDIEDVLAENFKVGDYLIEPSKHLNLQNSGDFELFELLGIFDCDATFSKIEVRNTAQISVRFQVRGYEKEFFKRGCLLIDKYFPVAFEKVPSKLRINTKPSLLYRPVTEHGNQVSKGSQQKSYDFIFEKMKLLDNELYKSQYNIMGYLTGCFNSDMSVNTFRRCLTINSTNHARIKRIHKASLLIGLKSYLHEINYKGVKEYRITYRGERTIRFILDNIDICEKNKIKKIKYILSCFEKRETVRGIRCHDGIVRILEITRETYTGSVYSIGVSNQSNPYYLAEGIISHNSLYPSIIRTWNIGPDTFIEDGDDYDKYITSANDCKFTCPTEKLSSIKSAIENLLNLRKVYKDKMNEYEDGSGEYKAYKAKQNAVKLLCNSMYGLMGYQYGRYYRKEIAEAITLGGQWLNKHTKKWFEAKGVSVIYGDSVTEDRMLLVRDCKGLVRNITFSELWDSSSEEVESNGKRYRNNVPFETISRSYTELSFEPIKYIVAHRVNKNIYRVWDNKGETCITEDHSLIDSTLTKRKFDEIDTLFTVKDEISSICKNKFEEIDIIDYLDSDSLSKWSIDSEYIWFDFDYDGRRNKIKRFYKGSDLKSLCRLIGFYVSCGHLVTVCNDERYMLAFRHTNDTYLDRINDDMKNILNVDIISKHNEMLLASLLSGLSGQCISERRLPDFVFNIGNGYKSILLKWMVIGNGGTYDPCRILDFKYKSVSKTLTNNISCVLSMLGLRYFIRYDKLNINWDIVISQHDYTGRVYSELVEYDGDVYDIEVGVNHNFFDTFGFIGLHNTDSVFIKADAEFRDTIDDLLRELHDFYNDILFEYFGVKSHFIELEYEKWFKRLLLLKKKHYVGNIIELDGHKTDKMVIKGMECIKRDTIPLGKRWQRDLIEMLIREEHDAYFYAKWITEKMGLFFNGEIAIEDITIKKKLTKSPKSYKTPNAHVKVAKEMLEKEMECYVGMQIPYIIIDHSPMVAVHPDWYKGNASMEYYWDLQIFGILKRPLQCAFPDYDWDQYSTKVVSKREKRKEQFIKWFNDPKKKKDKLLEKLNADKMLSDVDRNEIKVKSNIKLKRVMKIKK